MRFSFGFFAVSISLLSLVASEYHDLYQRDEAELYEYDEEFYRREIDDSLEDLIARKERSPKVQHYPEPIASPCPNCGYLVKAYTRDTDVRCPGCDMELKWGRTIGREGVRRDGWTSAH